ncbi:MazG nucleotide pyrophosphohydrolase domain-containing protein [Corynebacterium sp. Marseille-P4321]|uniref:MazG nucleotide pyrophosphohydrolase domain-containing protein n=1 Tax=Corynebacterium sp. Marseille-P4321 TaxID=2736603 RepID=UPI000893C60E|nr:MazG nucleotide pyrophosphohydrolase domain-containing protein [Corynebacterium sp. Marseille-P4321]OEY04245.1 hypothetical protein A0K93_07400 [Corynebacterium sp. BCW_4722]
MNVLLLDARFPDSIPAAWVGRHAVCTEEVADSVRRLFAPDGAQAVVTTDITRPEVEQLLIDGAPLLTAPTLSDPVAEAVRVMGEARRRGEWERAMTHESLLPFLEEEAAEVAEVITSGGSDEELKKELSDLLLQVLFHAEIAAERGAFDFADVAAAFVAKMRSRAPYLFDGSTGTVDKATQDRLWAEGKAREKRGS